MKSSEVAEVLSCVIDPELGIDIVSLGLIYGIEVTDGAIRVELTMTSSDCPMGDAIAGMAAGRLSRATGGRQLSLEIVTEPAWNIGMADRNARAQLGLAPA